MIVPSEVISGRIWAGEIICLGRWGPQKEEIGGSALAYYPRVVLVLGEENLLGIFIFLKIHPPAQPPDTSPFIFLLPHTNFPMLKKEQLKSTAQRC